MRQGLLPLVLLAWILGGLGERVHDLQHLPSAPSTIEAEGVEGVEGVEGDAAHALQVVSVEHDCAYELCGWGWGSLGLGWILIGGPRPLRPRSLRLPGDPRGPPVLDFAPKTSPPCRA
ncbi:MAG TPA: hypothetical protein ENK18_24035 [Deltaproteobacteria bacterium]|nr:hypothetical protein [Deltaproteobacteria bacterium]